MLTPVIEFLACAIAGAGGLIAVHNITMGGRDWDLMSFPVLFYSLLGFVCLARCERAKIYVRQIGLAVVPIMALRTGLWIGINADADRAVLRLGNLLYHTPNQALHYRKFTEGYYYLNVLNDPARAVPYLRSALAQAPPDTFAVGRMYKKRYLGFLATALVATEQYAEAIATSRQAIDRKSVV